MASVGIDLSRKRLLQKRWVYSSTYLGSVHRPYSIQRRRALKQGLTTSGFKRRFKHSEASNDSIQSRWHSVMERLTDSTRQTVKGSLDRFSYIYAHDKIMYGVSPKSKNTALEQNIVSDMHYGEDAKMGLDDECVQCHGIQAERTVLATASLKLKRNALGDTVTAVNDALDSISEEIENNKLQDARTDLRDGNHTDVLIQHSREQHDLASALTSKYESVQTYYESAAEQELHSADNQFQKLVVERELESIVEDVEADDVKNVTEAEPLTDSRAQRIIKSAGATVAGSQEYLSGVVRRIPLANILPSRKVTVDSGKSVKPAESNKTEQKVVPKRPMPRTRRAAHEKRTRELTLAVIQATGSPSKMTRLEDLCAQLIQHPETRGMALQENIIPNLLHMHSDSNRFIQQQSSLALTLLGYITPVRGRGVRILSLDGGGTRGFYSLEILRQLENYTGKRIVDMFDVICGVSAGALVCTLLGASNLTISQCEERFRKFSKQMFSQSRVPGISKLISKHSYYNTQLYEEVLRSNVGEATFLDTVKNPLCPKLITVSAIMNSERIGNFLFRNYQYPIGRSSRYPGSMAYTLWEAVRASSAAPGYYEDYKLGDYIHVDGGLLSNNPTAIALHEANVLWPTAEIQCIVSIGTGRYEPAASHKQQLDFIPLKDKLLKIVQSATNTEGIHTTLHDLLPPDTYFRFNPYMSEDFQLDEIRDEAWQRMYQDTRMYCHKNERKFVSCARQLAQPKTSRQRLQEQSRLAYNKYYPSLFGHSRRSSKL